MSDKEKIQAKVVTLRRTRRWQVVLDYFVRGLFWGAIPAGLLILASRVWIIPANEYMVAGAILGAVTLGFLDDGKTRVKLFERNDKMIALMAKFTERGNHMTNCVDFRPKPNAMNCKWCPFGPGGTDACLFGVSPL